MKAQHSIWRIEINRKRSLLHQLWTTGPHSCRARRWRNNDGEGVLPLGGSRYLCVYVSVCVCGANLGLLLIPLADADHRPARSLYLLQHRRPDVQTCTVCTTQSVFLIATSESCVHIFRRFQGYPLHFRQSANKMFKCHKIPTKRDLLFYMTKPFELLVFLAARLCTALKCYQFWENPTQKGFIILYSMTKPFDLHVFLAARLWTVLKCYQVRVMVGVFFGPLYLIATIVLRFV